MLTVMSVSANAIYPVQWKTLQRTSLAWTARSQALGKPSNTFLKIVVSLALKFVKVDFNWDLYVDRLLTL
jgi:hypothetical protein